MKEINCTNCSGITKISEEYFNSNDMIFDCSICGAIMKRNKTSESWQSSGGSVPVNKESIQNVPQSKLTTLDQRLDNWGDFIVIIAWIISAFSLLLTMFISMKHGSLLIIFDAVIKITPFLLFAHFIRLLLQCLKRHLDNQHQLIINTARKTKE